MKNKQGKISLDKLPKTTAKSKKRVGRGYGSGRGGHTAGRGAKGLKARGKVPLTFAGTKMKKSFLKRLPLLRGKGKFKSFKAKPVIVNVKYLNLLPNDVVVNLDSLIKHKVVTEKEAKKFGVKILGEGELNVCLKVELPCSKGAVEEIERAGGSVVTLIKDKKKKVKAEGKDEKERSAVKKQTGASGKKKASVKKGGGKDE